MAEREAQYRHNHYVPRWYQRRFLRPGQSKFNYLDLAPDVRAGNGHTWTRAALLRWGPSRCFAQSDLYTTRWGTVTNVDIEKFFFGELDSEGQHSVEWLAGFDHDDHTSFDGDALRALLRYMSVQKLRTPKGLAWLSQIRRSRHQNVTLLELQRLEQMFCATWSDAVWQVADASRSETKFIVSDHPVTIYNRDCFPLSASCRFPNDPDIRLVGSQTIFPLSLEKALLLTNLAWVRNPYQNPTRSGPNTRLFREGVFNFQDVQVDRHLTEEEVREINYVIKRRAARYVAAAEEDWLYPKRYLRCDHWRKLGDGYLLMPDPRHVHMGGEVLIGYGNGRSDAFGAYGHRPWERGYEDKQREEAETASLERFKDEFAAMVGRGYRGLAITFGRRREAASEELHEHHLSRDRARMKDPAERKRRRDLRRS